MVDGRRRMPEHGYTISSPCGPNGSGKIYIAKFDFVDKLFKVNQG